MLTVGIIVAQEAARVATIAIASVRCRAGRAEKREGNESGGRLHVVGGLRSEFALSLQLNARNRAV